MSYNMVLAVITHIIDLMMKAEQFPVQPWQYVSHSLVTGRGMAQERDTCDEVD